MPSENVWVDYVFSQSARKKEPFLKHGQDTYTSYFKQN